jgi:hypothetical protein
VFTLLEAVVGLFAFIVDLLFPGNDRQGRRERRLGCALFGFGCLVCFAYVLYDLYWRR